MTTTSERLARVALARLTEPGDPRVASLVAELGATKVHEHLAAERDVRGLLTDVAARLEAMDPARDLEQAERLGIRFVIPGDEEWPRRVDDLAGVAPVQDRGGAPLGLWVRGPLGLHELESSVAVVGSRSATSYGADLAAAIGAELARADQTVVSGAAFGIDQAAHRGALAMGGPTVAVLACGVDRAYPVAHKPLLDHLAATGAVVSELAPGCAPTRLRFLSRNRLIAALTTRHRRGRGGPAQRRPQHRQLGGAPQPPPDGRARPGHQRAVGGRAPADPDRRGHAGHVRRRGARGRESGRRPPARAAARARHAPATG